ncbi:hypothetical protein [Mycolicibacterium sp. SCSIO 43805]|uniref:hypothetical protein n=1 Tax=Mycolicibacterium sp. SCSIO 43805 TaxID=3378074 RepID=UPI003AB84D4E
MPGNLSVNVDRPDDATRYQRLVLRVGQAEPLSQHLLAVDPETGPVLRTDPGKFVNLGTTP